jgi:hypothetical protein
MTSYPNLINYVPFNPEAKEAFKKARKHTPVPQPEAIATISALLNTSIEEVTRKMPGLKEHKGNVVLEIYPAQDKSDTFYRFGFLTPPFGPTENRSDNWYYKIDFITGEIDYIPKQISRAEIKGVLNKN